MTSTYADRWGAPVQAADGAAGLLVLANGGDETWLAW
jgi:hypothetical protein